MAMPAGIGAIDLMLGLPTDDPTGGYESLEDVPELQPGGDPVALALRAMDEVGVERAMIDVDFDAEDAVRALKQHPDRFFGSVEVNPNRGMEEVRRLVALYETFGVKAATAFPAGTFPQVPLNDKKFYPLYARCVELDLPICVCVGVPEPRVPMMCQHVELIDEVCWFFPELKLVMRHGAEPWTELAVKLMLKWPNLYYSTSAFAPRRYPRAIVDYANTRGADKVMYAGCFPMGLSLARIWKELPDVPFRDAVWPKFLRENAIRVFGL